MTDHLTDPMAEISAMQKLAEALSGLDINATARVLRWAGERYGVALDVHAKSGGRTGKLAGGENETDSETNGDTHSRFTDLAELHAAASPETDADRALVAGYWFQYAQGETEFGSQAINSALKNLGHPISNITSAFNNLKARRPAFVVQIKKAGTSRQARKTYKLTTAGKSAVELLIGQR